MGSRRRSGPCVRKCCEGNGPRNKSERPRKKAPRLFLFGVWLEEDLDRHLCNAGIRRLSRPECPKRVAADLVEGTDVVRGIDGARADAFGRKVRMVKDIEVLRS